MKNVSSEDLKLIGAIAYNAVTLGLGLTTTQLVDLQGAWVNDISFEDAAYKSGASLHVVKVFYHLRDLMFFSNNGTWPDSFSSFDLDSLTPQPASELKKELNV